MWGWLMRSLRMSERGEGVTNGMVLMFCALLSLDQRFWGGYLLGYQISVSVSLWSLFVVFLGAFGHHWLWRSKQDGKACVTCGFCWCNLEYGLQVSLTVCLLHLPSTLRSQEQNMMDPVCYFFLSYTNYMVIHRVDIWIHIHIGACLFDLRCVSFNLPTTMVASHLVKQQYIMV